MNTLKQTYDTAIERGRRVAIGAGILAVAATPAAIAETAVAAPVNAAQPNVNNVANYGQVNQLREPGSPLAKDFHPGDGFGPFSVNANNQGQLPGGMDGGIAYNVKPQ